MVRCTNIQRTAGDRGDGTCPGAREGRPNAKEARLSYHLAEGGPDGFYRKMGFVDTGEMWDDEHVMVLVFRSVLTTT